MRPTLTVPENAIRIISSTQAAASNGHPTVTKPVGLPGDLLLVAIHENAEINGMNDDNGTTPTTEALDTPATSSIFAIYYRVLGPAEPASYTYVPTFSDQRWAMVAWVLRDAVSPAVGWEVAPAFGNNYAAGTGTIVCPGVTTRSNRAMAFAIGGFDGVADSFTSGPQGWTEIQTVAAGTQPLAVYAKDVFPGRATGDQTFTAGTTNAKATLAVFAVTATKRTRPLMRLAAAA